MSSSVRRAVRGGYLIFGSADIGAAGAIDLGQLNGFNGAKLLTEGAGRSNGASVSDAGDLNGDGIDDVVIAGPAVPAGGPLGVPSYVLFGRRQIPEPTAAVIAALAIVILVIHRENRVQLLSLDH